MGRTPQRVIATLVFVALVSAVPATAQAAGLTDAKRVRRAATYLKTQQQPNGAINAFSPIGSTADAVLAFVVAKRGRAPMNKALSFLENRTANGAVDAIGLKAKVVLAAAAGGKNPRNFGGVNLVQALRSELQPNGRYGDAVVFDDALVVLALQAVGAQYPPSALNWLLDAQCPDGGWSYDEPYDPVHDDAHCYDGSPTDFFTSDSNSTSYVVMALARAGNTSWDHNPFTFFQGVRDPGRGGWSYSDQFIATDANSTALVLQAYRAAKRAIPSGAVQSLRALQYNQCGAWAYTWEGNAKGAPNVGATIGAIPGLLLKPFPLKGKVAKGLPKISAC